MWLITKIWTREVRSERLQGSLTISFKNELMRFEFGVMFD